MLLPNPALHGFQQGFHLSRIETYEIHQQQIFGQVGNDDLQRFLAVNVFFLHTLYINGNGFRMPAFIPIIGKKRCLKAED